MMQTALIIENEDVAAERLKRLLLTYNPDIVVVEVLRSIQESVSWLQDNKEPDVIFLDVELNDGLSIDIFKQVQVSAPVIFTTSHRQYAYDAFQLNGAAYLLKPFFYKAMEEALKKAESHIAHDTGSKPPEPVSGNNPGSFKSRFISKLNNEMTIIPTEKIYYFSVRYGAVFCSTTEGTTHQLDTSLDTLESELDPLRFFRLNRKYIACIDAIEKVSSYSSSRLAVKLKNNNDRILVGREKSNTFKTWLKS
ncbi:MAG: LytTR family DNA-binding domain-containing protein [Roseivirga sp.]